MISINNITVSYNDNIVLSDLNINFEPQNIHGIIGLNGSGKTTLLNAIYGIRKLDKGSILYKGENLKRTLISYLEAENYFYSHITGREYLDLFLSGYSYYHTNQWNSLFKLPLNQEIESYSTGMKKKLAIMAIFKQNRPIYILDEPFNGIDIEFVFTLKSMIQKAKENGSTIIVTSHIMETLTNVCDFIHVLENQKIISSHDREEFHVLAQNINSKLENGSKEIIDDLF